MLLLIIQALAVEPVAASATPSTEPAAEPAEPTATKPPPASPAAPSGTALDKLDELLDVEDVEGSAARFQKEIQLADAAGDADAALQYRTQLARTLGLRGSYDEAHALLDGLDEESASPVGRIRMHLERGRVFRSQGKPAEALPEFQTAYSNAEAAKHAYLALDAAHMLAITEGADPSFGPKAIALAKATEDARARRWLGPLLDNQAWTLHDARKYGEAYRYFQEALGFYEEHGTERQVHRALYGLGRCMRSQKRYEDAWRIQSGLQTAEDGRVYEELGELALVLGRDAQPYFARAYHLLKNDTDFVTHERARFDRITRMGR